jgi:hypothetical protein
MNSAASTQFSANSGIELGTTVTWRASRPRLAGVGAGVARSSSSTVTVTVLPKAC